LRAPATISNNPKKSAPYGAFLLARIHRQKHPRGSTLEAPRIWLQRKNGGAAFYEDWWKTVTEWIQVRFWNRFRKPEFGIWLVLNIRCLNNVIDPCIFLHKVKPHEISLRNCLRILSFNFFIRIYTERGVGRVSQLHQGSCSSDYLLWENLNTRIC